MIDKITYENYTFTPFITEGQIQVRIRELAKQISEDYKGKDPVFVGVLNGSFLFMADLVRQFVGDCEVDFIKVSSYGKEMHSSGSVELLKDINVKAKDRHIIIVEDIVDTGLSYSFLKSQIDMRSPASTAVVTLLHKPEALKYDVKIDYIGFVIPNKFVIGYGLDLAQRFRNLREIYALSEE